jgi:hypothetical protein
MKRKFDDHVDHEQQSEQCNKVVYIQPLASGGAEDCEYKKPESLIDKFKRVVVVKNAIINRSIPSYIN